MDAYRDTDHALRSVVSHWCEKIQHARNHKKKVFQEDADECLAFFNGPRNWDQLMGGASGINNQDLAPDPMFKMSVNKVFEFVTIFGPALYHENPVRTVTPRTPVDLPMEFFPDPMVYQAITIQEQQRLLTDGVRSSLLETYLNWTPIENDLGVAARMAIDEALIKGRGCLWTELATPPGTTFRTVCSSYDSVDNLLIDPDATSLDKATWIARRCTHPVWQVERDYGLKPGTLKGNMESQAVQSEIAADSDALYDRKRGLTNDLLTYWKIYSKMGIGGRLSGLRRDLRGPLEMFGDYVFLVIAKDVPFPLNLPPELQAKAGFEGDPAVEKEVLDRVAWPTPFWADGSWPVACLDFHRLPNTPWPVAHVRAGIGELKFLNWAMSFLAGKLRNTCRDFIAIAKGAGEEIKTNILEGKDLTLLEIEGQNGKVVQELIQILQFPPVNGDIWKMIAAVEENFDKRVGLTELMYGEQGDKQIRSAQEAQIRNQNLSIRPDDMAKQVEAWMSEVARKEAVTSRWHLASADITPLMGPIAGYFWDQYVVTQDLVEVTRSLDYRIEAGSTKKPNKDTQVSQMTEGMQVLLPVFQGYGQQTGDMSPLNNLVADWAKSRDMNPARYQMQMAYPPPMPEGNPQPTEDPNGPPSVA